MKKKNIFIFSPWFTGVIFIVFAMSMAFATFVEKDLGAVISKKYMYNTRYFEILFLLLIINLFGQVFNLKLYKRKKLTILLFHLSFVLIVLGAAITRYFGFEGVMHIREGELNNECTIINTYSRKEINKTSFYLPFNIKLNDFILERYPGSKSPASYRSKVEVIDKENKVQFTYDIYMNHILKYRGYRFYQSSFDDDERGTILSVSKDMAGIAITYTGYFSLFLFLTLSLLNKNSLFRKINKKSWNISVSKIVILIIPLSLFTQSAKSGEKLVVHKPVANSFGEILVQNQKGRTEPLYSLSSDILRKLTGDFKYEKYNSMQVFMGLYFDFDHWKDVPFIKISNRKIQETLEVKSKYVSFSDVVDLETNFYKLALPVERAYLKPVSKRSKQDKEIIKADEKINICFMVYSGQFLKIFPINKKESWEKPVNAAAYSRSIEDSLYLANIIGLIKTELTSGNHSSNQNLIAYIASIKNYQQKYTSYPIPSQTKIKTEILYHKINFFEKLFPFYAMLGVVLLFILLYRIISKRKRLKVLIKIMFALLLLGFVFHTAGLVTRWYISGHAPMSNGYESMLFISWVTILAGFIFGRKQYFILAATSVLSALTLLVAHLSFMDPEITNLVPVLQSYWLTLHVSVITGSYGFLGLSAVIGLIVLSLYILSVKQNKEHIQNIILELSVISYKSLTVGLYLLTIGTFLGAIWANESWGRYWGWDPKETWSLITIIAYSFIIHSKNIDGLKSVFIFNVMTLYGFSFVLMTYFGVNYYLSGLHSYAGGQPASVPLFVYISLFLILTLSVWAYVKYKKVYPN